MASKFFLYWGSGSPPCWRMQLVAEEKGIKGYDNKVIEFSKNQHKGEDVLKWNPRGQVPTFIVDNSYSINESLAICDCLERLYPNQGTQLTPTEPKELAKVLQRKYEALNFHTKAINYIHSFFEEGGDAASKDALPPGLFIPDIIPGRGRVIKSYLERAKLKKEFFEELKFWEKYAGESDFIAGSKHSIADFILFPDLALCVRFGLDLTKEAPNLHKYHERVTKLPSVQATWPPHWKDSAPPKSLF